jgi:hypothetical protein
MREPDKEKIEAAAVTGVGAGVGALAGRLVAGAPTFFFGYKLYRHLKKLKS